MHWNDHSFSGERDEWVWFVSRSPIAQLLDLTREEHLGARLWICTFDSGSITPNEEEASAGWSVADEAMVSPPMSIDLDVPCDQYDEWYIFPDSCSRLRGIERFVNYGGFTLADPRSMAKSFDASWEPNGLDAD